MYRTFKENYECKELIKASRSKYFFNGLFSAFCLFSFYLALWLVAQQTKSPIPWYVALGLIIVLGLVTIVYLSIYEFCIAFDVMYSQRGTELVHNLLEKVAGKKIKIVPDE
ncbi:hypothetical protein [Mycoplasma parvum]|uniref:Uncharacterized protein n=1 Tax=Mycoplasma parvum str. Indiana TaxID=1403316 RepID=U5NCB3_9MOLU|nr:hypothetical protein [Mycoplasma parvum]AGX89221.1 hypothetical protein PRV_02420 [Mycoplasma parvum str. Indiana]